MLAIGFVGLIFMIKPWNMQEGNTVIGMVYMMLAAIFFGAYTVAGKVSVQKMGIMSVLLKGEALKQQPKQSVRLFR